MRLNYVSTLKSMFYLRIEERRRKFFLFFFFLHGATASSGPGPHRGFTIALRHTTLGRTPLDE